MHHVRIWTKVQIATRPKNYISLCPFCIRVLRWRKRPWQKSTHQTAGPQSFGQHTKTIALQSKLFWEDFTQYLKLSALFGVDVLFCSLLISLICKGCDQGVNGLASCNRTTAMPKTAVAHDTHLITKILSDEF
eukprot:57125-Amphidinium_carterae.1